MNQAMQMERLGCGGYLHGFRVYGVMLSLLVRSQMHDQLLFRSAVVRP